MRQHLISYQLVHAMPNMATAAVSVQFVDEDVLKLKRYLWVAKRHEDLGL